jgi:hypothetical protein
MTAGKSPGTGGITLLAGLGLLATFIAVPTASAGTCSRFGDIVTLSGAYSPDAVPVVDGVERLPRTASGRLADLLLLPVPLCIASDDISQGVMEALSIQLHCPALQASGGDTIELTGRLVGAHTGNGHPPILLACRS